MTDEEMYMAIGALVLCFLITIFIMDQCKRRREGAEAMSHARRVQQDRTTTARRTKASDIDTSG